MNLDRKFIVTTGIMISVFLIHFILMKFIFQISKPYFFQIYVFLLVLLSASMLIILLLEKKFKEVLGFFFLVIITVKLVAAKLFMDYIDKMDENPFKFSFLILYLISLGLITWFAAQKLLNPES